MVKDVTNKLDQIFNATLRLTGKVGIAGLKMSGIAKEAGLASGTLYLYFKSKHELLNALYLQLQKEGASAITTEISHLPINIQLYKLWSAALKSLVENSYRMVFLEQFVVSPYISQVNKDIDAAFIKYLSDLLAKGKKEGLIKKVDNDILISLIIGFVRNYSARLVNNNNGLLTDKSIDESFTFCWLAISR